MNITLLPLFCLCPGRQGARRNAGSLLLFKHQTSARQSYPRIGKKRSHNPRSYHWAGEQCARCRSETLEVTFINFSDPRSGNRIISNKGHFCSLYRWHGRDQERWKQNLTDLTIPTLTCKPNIRQPDFRSDNRVLEDEENIPDSAFVKWLDTLC